MSKVKILIIEDEPDLTRLIAQSMKTAGYECITSKDAIQGMAVAQKERPDLIILDLMLPGGGGLAVLNRLRESSYTSMTPVIVLTGVKDEDYKRKVLAAGVSDYLEKPCAPEVLLKSIKKTLEKEDTKINKGKILVIEDDQDLAKLVARKLQETGYIAITAEDTVQGMTFAQKERPDLIILDLMLPGGGGLAVLNRLRESSYTSMTPVIVLTGVKDEDYKRKVLAAGVSDYLEKPCAPEVLLKSIEKVLGQEKPIRKENAVEGERIIVYVDADIEDLIPDFLSNRREDVKSIREALEEGDFQTIQTLGHRMKGVGGSYGFETITDIGRALEQAAKERSPETIRKKLDELSTYLEHVEVVVNE